MLIAQDAAGMQRDYDYTSARDPKMLRDPAGVGREAAARTLRRLGAKRPPTGTFPVLFDPTLASGLISHLLSGLAGGALYRQASFLCDRLGTPLFPDWFSLEERPPVRRLTARECKPVITALLIRAALQATCCLLTVRGD